MKSGRVKGGPALPAVIGTGRQFRSNLAQPVYNAASSSRGIMGGSARKIIEITSDDLVQNGGQYKLMGGPPTPMQIVTDRAEKGGAAQVVYPVDMLGNYDPSFAGYIYKVLTADEASGYDPSSLIGFWPQNELSGGVSIDHSGLGHDGAYTGVTLGQAGVPGMGMTSPLFDGANDFNNIYSADLANDNGLANPGFETPGAMPPTWLNWVDTLGDGAIANEVVIVHEGNDAAKLTSGPLSDTSTYGAVVVVPGQKRRFRFWSQGDGVNAGRYIIWDATNGANIVGMTSTGITAAAWGMVEAEYTVPAGCVLVHQFLACPNVNGGIAYFDACEDRRMNGFLGDQGTIIVPAQVANAGVWTDAVARNMVRVQVDGTNFLEMRTDGAGNIAWRYDAGGVTEFNQAPVADLAFVVYGMTWDISAGATGEVRYYIRGVPNGGVDVALGTWVGDLAAANVVIGAASTVPANVWSGNIGPALLYNEAKTPAEMLYLSTP